MNQDQYEIEAVMTEQWASREKCKVNIKLEPGIWRTVEHSKIDLLAYQIREALWALYCMDAVSPCRVRLYKGGCHERS